MGTWAVEISFLAGSSCQNHAAPPIGSQRKHSVKYWTHCWTARMVPDWAMHPNFGAALRHSFQRFIWCCPFSFKASLHASLEHLELYSHQCSWFSPPTPNATLFSSSSPIEQQQVISDRPQPTTGRPSNGPTSHLHSSSTPVRRLQSIRPAAH